MCTFWIRHVVPRRFRRLPHSSSGRNRNPGMLQLSEEDIFEEQSKPAQAKPVQSEKSLSKVKRRKARDKVSVDMYKIPEDRVGQKPDKCSAEYRFAHLQYYGYLVVEKFPLLGNATHAKANDIKKQTFQDWFLHQSVSSQSLQTFHQSISDNYCKFASLGEISRNGTIIFFRHVNTDKNV